VRRAFSYAGLERRAATFRSIFKLAAGTGQPIRRYRERQSKSAAGSGIISRLGNKPHVFSWCRYNFLRRDSASLPVWSLGCRLARDSSLFLSGPCVGI
jgi:hypothetical protein